MDLWCRWVYGDVNAMTMMMRRLIQEIAIEAQEIGGVVGLGLKALIIALELSMRLPAIPL